MNDQVAQQRCLPFVNSPASGRGVRGAHYESCNTKLQPTQSILKGVNAARMQL